MARREAESYSIRGGGIDYWSMLRESYQQIPEVTYTPGKDWGPQSIQVDDNGVIGDTADYYTSPGGEASLAYKTQATKATYTAAAGIGMQIGKELGDAVGAYLVAKGKAAQLNAQASITEDNARLAQLGVEQAFRNGEAQVAKIGYEQAEKKAQSRTAFAANGIALNVGSTAEHQASIDIKAAADKMTAEQNALAAAWGYRRQRIMGFATARGERLIAYAPRRAGRATMYSGIASTIMSAWSGYQGAK